jgi:hypothetical protein
MKSILKVVFVVLVALPIMAQKKYLAKDLGYSDEVKMVQEMEYKYDFNLKKYVAFSATTFEFTKGKLMRNVSINNESNYFKSETKLTYNNGFPETYTTKSQNFESNFSFKYNNGNLNEQTEIDGDETRVTEFKYNSKNQIIEISYKKNNKVYRIEEFKNYTNSNSYEQVIKKFENNKITHNEKITIKNGVLIAIDKQPDFVPEKETRVFDKNGNIIQYESYDGNVFRNVYVYDDKGNPNQLVRVGNPNSKYSKENIFVFTKILYNNESTSGSTDLDENFVKQYDINSESYAFDTSFSKKNSITRDLIFQEFEFLKNDENKISIQQRGGNEITESVEININKNNLDVIIYDFQSQETAIGYDFFNELTPKNKWITMHTMETSETEMYWLIDDSSNLYFIKYGKYMSTDSYKIIPSTKNENDLIIQEKGQNKFVLTDTKTAESNTLYPINNYNE